MEQQSAADAETGRQTMEVLRRASEDERLEYERLLQNALDHKSQDQSRLERRLEATQGKPATHTARASAATVAWGRQSAWRRRWQSGVRHSKLLSQHGTSAPCWCAEQAQEVQRRLSEAHAQAQAMQALLEQRIRQQAGAASLVEHELGSRLAASERSAILRLFQTPQERRGWST